MGLGKADALDANAFENLGGENSGKLARAVCKTGRRAAGRAQGLQAGTGRSRRHASLRRIAP